MVELVVCMRKARWLGLLFNRYLGKLGMWVDYMAVVVVVVVHGSLFEVWERLGASDTESEAVPDVLSAEVVGAEEGFMSEERSELVEHFAGLRERLAYEIANGGSECPCPFCGLPRCQRSDYIRCSQCGINWSPGDELDRDPRMSFLPRIARGLGSESEVPEVRKGI